MLNFRHILSESFLQAYRELVNNKLRTFLSLLGITIGIFCIISVQAAVDSLEDNIRGSFEKLGNDVVYIDKQPWEEPDSDNFWKYRRRPRPTYDEYVTIKNKSKLTDQISFSAFAGNKIVKYQKNVLEGSFCFGVTEDYANLFKLDLSAGRFFNVNEVNNASKIVVIGDEVAKSLFGTADPIGREIKIAGHGFKVVGVIEKAGKSLINPLNFDEGIIIPIKTIQLFINLNGKNYFSQINAKAKSGVNLEDFKDEITSILRAYRKIKPAEESNFALNELSMLHKVMDSVFGALKLAGVLIGIFSILVGIFSVANIMFVSVRERTHIIGIKKAIGAPPQVILLEFLIESIILCLLGGVVGLVLVFVVLKVLSVVTDFNMFLSFSNISIGVILSVVVGIISGFIPAYNASRLNPVDAIRQS